LPSPHNRYGERGMKATLPIFINPILCLKENTSGCVGSIPLAPSGSKSVLQILSPHAEGEFFLYIPSPLWGEGRVRGLTIVPMLSFSGAHCGLSTIVSPLSLPTMSSRSPYSFHSELGQRPLALSDMEGALSTPPHASGADSPRKISFYRDSWLPLVMTFSSSIRCLAHSTKGRLIDRSGSPE